MVGTPFRPQGRDRETGLDCLGVVALSFGLEPGGVPNYRLTDGDWPLIIGKLSPWFDLSEALSPQSNDVLVIRLARGFHFGVVSDRHLIHADAVAGKVLARRLPTRIGQGCRLFSYRRKI